MSKHRHFYWLEIGNWSLFTAKRGGVFEGGVIIFSAELPGGVRRKNACCVWGGPILFGTCFKGGPKKIRVIPRQPKKIIFIVIS